MSWPTPLRLVDGNAPPPGTSTSTSTSTTAAARKRQRASTAAREMISWRRSPSKKDLLRGSGAPREEEEEEASLLALGGGGGGGGTTTTGEVRTPGPGPGSRRLGEGVRFPESPHSQSETRKVRPSLLGAALAAASVATSPVADAVRGGGDAATDELLLAALQHSLAGANAGATAAASASASASATAATTITATSDRVEFELAAQAHACLSLDDNDTSHPPRPLDGALAPVSASSAPPGVFAARFKVHDVWETPRGKSLRLLCRSSPGEDLAAAGQAEVTTATTTTTTTDDDDADPSTRFELCLLTDAWRSTPVRVGDVVNVIWTTPLPPATSSSSVSPLAARLASCNHQITISNHENFLVLLPDVLISPTSIAGSNSCIRRTVMRERILMDGVSRDTVLGNLRHDMFERSLQARVFDEDDLSKMIQRDVVGAPRNVEGMFAVNMREAEAVEELEALVKGLATWGAAHFSGTRLEFGVTGPAMTSARIHRVVATEDTIVSPMWGLKARMDATVVWALQQQQQQEQQQHPQQHPHPESGGGAEEFFTITPLELKTGRVHRVEHRAQVTLYSLLIGDRYMGAIHPSPLPVCGVLVHADAKAGFVTTGVPRMHGELRDLIMLRNRLAVSRSPVLVESPAGADAPPPSLLPTIPPVTGNVSGECDRCFNRDACVLQHVVKEKRPFAEMNLSTTVLEDTLGHLTPSELAYFERWCTILDHEELFTESADRELWRMSGPEREQRGRCVSGLRLSMSQRHLDQGEVELSRRGGAPIRFGELNMELGDWVALGVDGAHAVVTRGVLMAVTSFTITVRAVLCKLPPVLETSDKWRVDKYDAGFSAKAIRNTLGMWLLKPPKSSAPPSQQSQPGEDGNGAAVGGSGSGGGGSGGDEDTTRMIKFNQDMRLRALIIENRPPRFHPDVRGKSFSLLEKLLARCGSPEEVRFGLSRGRVDESASPRQRELAGEFAALTEDQKTAVLSVLAAKDYLLVSGVPGAGKTTTLAFVIRMLWTLGRSVLVTSWTHSAVDNLLLKVKEHGIPVVRVQNASRFEKAHADLKDCMLGRSTQELEQCATQDNLVAGFTCLATMRHPLLSRRRFDYCIIDEAGQLNEMVSLGPMRCADVSILIGDKNQLPPLVKSEEARRMGMDVSLFERLAVLHPAAVVNLETQFRMNRDINALANELVYKSKLKCGSKEVEFRRLRAPNFPGGGGVSGWLLACVDPGRSVVFVNTDQLGDRAREARLDGGGGGPVASSTPPSTTLQAVNGAYVVNECEAQLTQVIVDRLARCGTPLGEVAVISPYRAQLRLLRQRLVDVVEVSTVDRFQGRDKSCIIISLVRSNPERDVGSLLLDWRRLNVAFTRAKCKLVVVGSASTLVGSPICQAFLRIVERRGWVVHVPPGSTSSSSLVGGGGGRGMQVIQKS